MEFGVLNGEGSVDIIRQFRSSGYKTHYGFDSFEGFGRIDDVDTRNVHLQPAFDRNAYAGLSLDDCHRSIKSHTRSGATLKLTRGFFSETLRSFDKSQLDGFPLLLYVDCDLYQSSTEVFEFLDAIVQNGSWILCDDYWCYRGHPKAGQRRALDEWLARSSRVGVTPYCNFNGFGRAFIAYVKD